MERHLLLFRTLEVDQMRSLNSGLLEMFLILSKTPVEVEFMKKTVLWFQQVRP